MPIYVAVILGLIAAITCTVLLYVFVMPKKKDGKLENKFLQGLHDYFQFKRLYVEDIMKFLFMLLSLLCVGVGFFMLFSGYASYWGGYTSYFLPGLMLMVLGPVILRITYEMVMLTILMVRNTIEINNKMDKVLAKDAPAAVKAEEPATQE